MVLTLGYWDIRALAEPIRYLLHYKGQEFEDKRYVIRPESWLNDKFSLGLSFPNLPYLIDGDIKLTQSTTILRYLARKLNLVGKTEEETLRVELIEQQLIDFRINLIRLCINPDFEKLKDDFVKGVPAQMKLFSEFLGNRKFLAGNSITYVDFMAYDTFDFYNYLIPNVLKDFPNLFEYQNRLKNLPELQSYFNSKTYKRWPIFAPFAKFGGHGEEPKHAS